MGISLFKNCTVYPSSPQAIAPNPDPLNFRILDLEQVGNQVVAKIKYPDCTNFEGVKVCVFANTTCAELKGRRSIDPHFSEAGTGPIARFEPTIRGAKLACELAVSMGV
jgi:hypothetical protein